MSTNTVRRHQTCETGKSCVNHLVTASLVVNSPLPRSMQMIPRVVLERGVFNCVRARLGRVKI